MTKKIYTIMKEGRPYTYSGYRYPKPHYPLPGLDEMFCDDASLITDLPEEKYREALSVLNDWFMESSKTSCRHNSYSMKHWLEGAIGYYISNNQLKDAMLMLGFEPGNWEELNWYFKVKPTTKLRKYLERVYLRW